ncbi:MAG: ATP-grasp domain-containing protein [Candidatus Hydrogenedentes bacterium]|nr:ATP-grasp domain-containing protein [Candidatus Hydrogenedentota bacterium]
MKPLDCLIFAGAQDAQAKRVLKEMRRIGGRVRLFDTNTFPGSPAASIEEGALRLGRAAMLIPHNAWLRGLAFHPLMPGSDGNLALRPRGWIAQCDEKRAMIESLIRLLALRGTRLVNSLEANALHSQKPLQLALLHRAGVPVPRSLATNDPAAVRGFARTLKRVVYKPLSGGAEVLELSAEDLTEARLGSLATAPVLFQEYIAGLAVRAYVLGRKVLGAAAIEAATLDYRADEAAALRPVKLTAEERSVMIRSATASGMHFAGIDFIRQTKGISVLDINPSPMFAVFEGRTGIDIAGPLAKWMCRR